MYKIGKIEENIFKKKLLFRISYLSTFHNLIKFRIGEKRQQKKKQENIHERTPM